MRRFDTVLVANRGEIAVRVIGACREAGLRSVAVYSDPDRDAPHVRAADAAVRIGPAAARDSYLDVDAVVEAALRSGAQAIHPGYGFLSERARFARAVVDAGLVFIGPPADVMDAMGRKDRARAVATAAGVPVVPAAVEVDNLDAVASQVGFPMLVKAAAGGGGKGMRVVLGRDELAAAVAAARREAAAAFGDDTMLFERYIEHGRHIEVQVLADEHGNVVHLFERDCSVQRRHQKVVEEAPATAISGRVRDVVLTSAVALAAEVGYVNAGTVEFLVSGDDAYFLEMNTRLQVEHPVTELVTGRDLVALQFLVAQGDPLPFTQDDVTVTGHAVEARIYAEDPRRGFLPQAGRADVVVWPEGVRVDAALDPGQFVGTNYDPMLAKVIAYGPTREAARRRLVQSLDETAIIGLTTNVGFLRSLVGSDAFQRSAIDTGWLDHHHEVATVPVPDEAWVLGAWALARAGRAVSTGPFDLPDGWRLGGPPAGIPIELRSVDGAEPADRLLVVAAAEGTVRVADRLHQVRDGGFAGDRLRLEIDQDLVAAHVVATTTGVQVAYRGQTWTFARPDPFSSAQRAGTGDGSVESPMPGTVLVVNVAVGDEVSEGQTLGAMEAMKMELALSAPISGRVTAVNVSPGMQVDRGATLFVVSPEDEDEEEK